MNQREIKIKQKKYKDIADRLFDEAQKSALDGDNKLCALLLVASAMIKNKKSQTYEKENKDT